MRTSRLPSARSPSCRGRTRTGRRAKSGGRTVPVGPDLIRLYADYLHEEYGGIDSDYVFVNLFAEPKGHGMVVPGGL